MRKQAKQTTSGLPEARQDTSLVLSIAGRAQADDGKPSKPARQSRREKTGDRPGRMSATSGHSVFVLDHEGNPLSPTTPAKARKLLGGGAAEKTWSKFGTFGIRLKSPGRRETPKVVLGVDHGSKFEGYSLISGVENLINVKLDLPDKKKISDKIEERRLLRKARRHRNCRRRPRRSCNRGRIRSGSLVPSHKVLVDSRLKVLGEICRLYPVKVAGVENARFNFRRYMGRMSSIFVDMEIGKSKIQEFFEDRRINVVEYYGFETQELRLGFGYQKTSEKSADQFESHCSDSLALACSVGPGHRVDPGLFIVVDDTYRPVRRRLHDTQPGPGGIRDRYSTGNVAGLRKGILIGTRLRRGVFCGLNRGYFRYYDSNWKRQVTKTILWISSSFIVKQAR